MKVYERLLKLGVFTINDLDEMFGNRNSSNSALKTLLKKDLVQSIKKNLYVCNDIENKVPIVDKYKIGSSITKDSYISHHSALEFHGLSHQIFFEVFVSSSTQFKSFDFNGIRYRYGASKGNKGVESITTNRNLRVTDVERTVIDCIKDIEKAGGLEELLQCIRLITYLDSKKLEKYLLMYNIQFVYQKTGYILYHFKEQLKLSQDFFEFCLDRINKSKRYLVDMDEKGLVYNSKWRLYVPKNLMSFLEQGSDYLV